MAIIESIRECIKDAFPSDYEVLFRYTEKIKSNNQWENLLVNNINKIFYINYPNQKTYIAIGQCKEYIINSNKNLIALKNLQHKMYSYGKNRNETLKLFGGISFNLEEQPKDFWKGLPKGSFCIPEFLIIKNKGEYSISYYRFINHSSNAKKISSEYELFIEQLRDTLEVQKTTLTFKENIPNKKTYSKIFSNLSNSIKNEDISKVVLSRMKKFSVNNKIVLKDTSCTNFYIDLEHNKRFFGTTPELLIEINNKILATSAIAGTLKKELNSNNLNNFLKNKKELSEHQYVVDDLIKKISIYCEKINKKNTPDILELDHLYHLYTPLKGQLKKNIHILDLAKKLHPTPAVLGTPKDRALDMITENEPFERGWYSGYIGWYDIDGNGRFDVAIRSALQIDKNLYCYAGGGLVKGSKEIDEWNETELKFQHLLSAIK